MCLVSAPELKIVGDQFEVFKKNWAFVGQWHALGQRIRGRGFEPRRSLGPASSKFGLILPEDTCPKMT